MIGRYEVAEISHFWTEEGKFKSYLEVEVAHLRTLEEDGLIEQGTSDLIAKASINPERIAEIEKVTNHDVIAFCTSITEQFPAEFGRYFHFGITSSDIIDTAHALLIKDCMAVIEKDLLVLKEALRKRTLETSRLLCIGRSHGISAEAMIFGQKFLSFEAELGRRLEDWKSARAELTGQMSGAVGNFTVISPEQEERTLRRLGLAVEPVSTQVIPRDRYAKIIGVGALLASLFERMAVEFRLLQHSDIDEVKEGFSRGQKGSSTMPHKKNPISSENLTGIARLIRAHVMPALEDCVLWHERDISHSSVERILLPDHFGLLAYSARRMKGIVENLVIDQKRIELKVSSNEKIYSSYVLHKLIEKNPSVRREELYEVVQKSFFSSSSLEELRTNLKLALDDKRLFHEVDNWIDVENLRTHYATEFQKLLRRVH